MICVVLLRSSSSSSSRIQQEQLFVSFFFCSVSLLTSFALVFESFCCCCYNCYSDLCCIQFKIGLGQMLVAAAAVMTADLLLLRCAGQANVTRTAR